TVFLDEIGELPLSLQGKLLRFIQERAFERLGGRRTIQVDVRLIAATNRDLETLVKEGLFREDLYFRLQVFPIKLPPLRERREDLPGLIEFLLRKLEKDYHRRLNFSPEALELLCQYHWPGNIRELENLLERLLITAKGPVRPEFLRRFLATKPAQQLWPRKDPSPEEIRAALEKHDFVIARAAKELGLTFRQLRYRLKKWGLDHEIKPRRGRPPQK
ncbi:MAG TPA: AAA family ATPase, partial [Thermodesulfatator atlanticus]|nr:AAA family ATPase [Thermodesulfatator atlanticus]